MKSLGRISLFVIAAGGMLLVLPAMRIRGGRTLAFTDARIKIEVNSTSGDAGIQAFVDSTDAWDHVIIEAPDGRKIFDVKGKGRLERLGSTELFFESREPSFDEMSPCDFLRLFPAGKYRIAGTTVDGDRLEAFAELTHDIPAGPVIVAPANGSSQDPDAVVIDWDPVTDPPGIRVAIYEVIVEEADVEPPRTFDLFLPASVTSVAVPPGFLESGRPYLIEVLAIEAGGNQTITEGSFSTK